MLAHQCAMRCRSPELCAAMLRNLLTDCLQLTPERLANPLRPGFLPSAKFSLMNSLALTPLSKLEQLVLHRLGVGVGSHYLDRVSIVVRVC